MSILCFLYEICAAFGILLYFMFYRELICPDVLKSFEEIFIELRIDGNLSFSVIFGMADQRHGKRCRNNYLTFFAGAFNNYFCNISLNFLCLFCKVIYCRDFLGFFKTKFCEKSFSKIT